MKPKTIKILYWIVTILFCAAMLMDGIAGLMRVQEGKEGLAHLGYPEYLMSIVGIAKVLGVLAILQTKFKTIKEWAYAGFTINFLGASLSHYFVGDATGMMFAPFVVLAFMFVSYYLWKKEESLA
ncbi:MAG: DoxX family protein [Chitinophagaceae bacterium]|nr:DoxX family protein [Chitinophagaceae bacterium]